MSLLWVRADLPNPFHKRFCQETWTYAIELPWLHPSSGAVSTTSSAPLASSSNPLGSRTDRRPSWCYCSCRVELGSKIFGMKLTSVFDFMHSIVHEIQVVTSFVKKYCWNKATYGPVSLQIFRWCRIKMIDGISIAVLQCIRISEATRTSLHRLKSKQNRPELFKNQLVCILQNGPCHRADWWN